MAYRFMQEMERKADNQDSCPYRLHRIFKRAMIPPALAARIIPSPKGSVQNIKRAQISYPNQDTAQAPNTETARPRARSISYTAWPISYIPGGILSGPISYIGSKVVGKAISYIAAIALILTIQCSQQSLDEFASEDEDSVSGSSSNNRETSDPPKKPGVIYARVSSNTQAEEGRSLGGQKDEMREAAARNEIDLICDPIEDEGETGTNFDRDGIKKVFQLASEQEIEYLLVDDISRIGRNAPETLYFIYMLQNDFDVRIITKTGLQNISQVQDLVQTAMQALISHMSTLYRTMSSQRSCLRAFEDKNWFSWYNQAPLGYTDTGDGWIKPDSEEADIIPIMYEQFLETESYTETAEAINEEFPEAIDAPRSYRQVKRDLQRRVYIGEPTVTSKATGDEELTECVVQDQALALVDEETFYQVQSVIDSKSTGESSKTSLDPETIIDEFGWLPVLRNTPVVKAICEDCGQEYRLNGQAELTEEFKAHYLECKNCEVQRKFPYKRELEAIQADGR